MNRFWMVWSPAGRTPTVQHLSEASAKNEANRLARANPGSEFHVLQSVGTAELPPLLPRWHEHEEPDESDLSF